jgi:hypothetical protein
MPSSMRDLVLLKKHYAARLGATFNSALTLTVAGAGSPIPDSAEGRIVRLAEMELGRLAHQRLQAIYAVDGDGEEDAKTIFLMHLALPPGEYPPVSTSSLIRVSVEILGNDKPARTDAAEEASAALGGVVYTRAKLNYLGQS